MGQLCWPFIASCARSRVHPGVPLNSRSIPDTWFTDYSGDIVNTFSGTKGFGVGSTRPSSRSKKLGSYQYERAHGLAPLSGG